MSAAADDEKMERRRLPNELLAEIANAMPAGIIDQEGFMDRMQPLAAFIEPIMLKFQSKGDAFLHNVEFQREAIIAKHERLKQDLKTLEEMPQDPMNVWKIFLFLRRQAALNQQKDELIAEIEECLTKHEADCSAWKRTFKFAKELVGEDKIGTDKNNKNDGQPSSNRKRKNLLAGRNDGENEEEESAEEMKKRKQ